MPIDTLQLLLDSSSIADDFLTSPTNVTEPCGSCISKSALTGSSGWLKDIVGIGVAIVVGLMATVTALIQVRWNVISSSRIKWIESFRNDISAYCEASIAMRTNYLNTISPVVRNDKDTFDRFYEKYCANNSQCNVLSYNIRLKLNLKKKRHIQIEQYLCDREKLFKQDRIESTTFEEVDDVLNLLIVETRNIAKEEWEKSKKIKFWKFWEL